MKTLILELKKYNKANKQEVALDQKELAVQNKYQDRLSDLEKQIEVLQQKNSDCFYEVNFR